MADASSSKLAQLSTQPENVDPAAELVNLKIAEQSGQAAAQVVKTADDMMGTTIDIRV
jgi:flagellar hook protein FlgE